MFFFKLTLKRVCDCYFRRLRFCCSEKHVKDVIYCYCLISDFLFWASTYPSRLEKIVVLQKKIIRITFARKYRDHTSNYFKESHILKFRDINFLQTALFMFNVDRQLLPSHLMKSFYQNNAVHCYCTRSFNNYHLESVNTNIKQFSIKYKGPILWNSIPLSIRSLKNIHFKRKIIHTLLKKYDII